MRTIFVTIFQAVEAKNILRTGVVAALLKEDDVRVVCLTRSEERAAYYRKEIADPRIMYVPFSEKPRGMFEKLFSALKFQLIKTKTTDLRRRMRFEETGNVFVYSVVRIFNSIVARPIFRSLFRFLDYYTVSDPGFKALFKEYAPEKVFLAHLFDDTEIALLREAKRYGVQTVALINSWDKVTARCLIRLLPDRFIVYNQIVKEELITHADAERDSITICGIPQYDHYFTLPVESREVFFNKLGIDPQKKLIVYAPMGAAFSNSDWEMIDVLSRMIEKHFALKAELLVRFQPNDFFDEGELKKRPRLKYDMPGVRYGKSRGGDWDMTFEDLAHLRNTLAHASLLISYASSISVDAAIFDVPIININFEVKPITLLSKSPTFYYGTEHYGKALKSGGIRLVKSEEELKDSIQAYLEDPALHKEGRKRLVNEQCSRTSGNAASCIAKTLLE